MRTVPGAIVYAADRIPRPWGEAFLQRAMGVIAAAERDLLIEDEVHRRLSDADALAAGRELGELYGELRTIADSITDDTARARLAAVCDRFATLVPQRPEAGEEEAVVLAPREAEVLAEIGKGGSNAEVAAHLGLRVTTVKSYVRSAMRKLDAGNRVHAVYRARQLRLIP